MTEGFIWSFALAAVGILGIYLAGRKNMWGWAVSLGAQVLWITYALVTSQPGFIVSAVAYSIVYGKNFVAWHAEERPRPAGRRRADPDHLGIEVFDELEEPETAPDGPRPRLGVAHGGRRARWSRTTL